MGRIGCFSCEKFRWDFVARTFAPVLSCFALSFVWQSNSRKCTQIVENRPKHELRVQWGGSGAFVAKNSDGTSWHELFHQFDLFYTKCCYATKQSQMHPNNTKHTKTCLGSNGVDRVLQVRKIPMGLRGMNFCTSSFPFCTEFCKATKQSQMHPNSRKQTKT